MAQEFESQFKPIVSGSDYLSGSEFGQVAGALLARRDKQDKKQAKRALLASAVLEGLGALQRNQKQDVIDAINETNEKYSDIFEENKEYYNDESIAEQRKLYQLYKNEKTRDTALLTQAIRTFNQDSDIMATYGPNAFTTVSQMKKTPEGNQTLADEIDLLKDQAKNYFESITDEAITLPTFTKYNAKAKNAYLAAIAEVKNDPTKKGLVRAAWLKVFGRDKEGNPRFGLVQQDKLKRARETAESIAGIATDIDKQRVENINKEAEIKTDKREITTDFGRVDERLDMIPKQRTILFEAINRQTRNNAFINKDEYSYKIDDKEYTGKDVYDYYTELGKTKGPDEQIEFLENILNRAAVYKNNYEETDTTGKFKSDITFVREAVSDYFAETLTTDNPNTTRFNPEETKLFDLEEPITVILGGREVTTKLGSLIEIMKTETKENASQIISDVTNSLDNPAVINHLESTYMKQFGIDKEESDFDSFFEYEKTFRTNPLSIPE
tara:strand:- start:860 stop:2353 length:1494 start_codon:yes stop_codon:yes gene_type:complete